MSPGTAPTRLCSRSDRFRTLFAAQRGQALPLFMGVMIALLAAGMIVFWLTTGAYLRSKAQTAADAAALGGEQEVVRELSTPRIVDGQYLPPVINPGEVEQAANRSANANGGTVIAFDLSGSPTGGTDVLVTVTTNQKLPKGAIKAGSGGTAQARASTDPFSQSSAPITSATSCDASVSSGPHFVAHGGDYGFFPAPGTNYGTNCEPQIAGRLDQLGHDLKLHLVGLEGTVGNTQPSDANPSLATAHSCGAASKTQGIPAKVDLKKYGLTRPFSGDPQEIELASTSASGCTQVSGDAGSANVGFGNPSVHLVDVNGGPVGSFLLSPIGGFSLNESQLQVACTIYQVGQSLRVPQLVMYSAFLTGFDESQMGANTGGNTTDPSQSVGVFQQIEADGWGTIPEELNPTTAAQMYFQGGNNEHGSTHGALYWYAQNPNVPAWHLAQETQGSGAGQSSGGLSNYGAASNVAEANAMLAKVQGGQCAGVNG